MEERIEFDEMNDMLDLFMSLADRPVMIEREGLERVKLAVGALRSRAAYLEDKQKEAIEVLDTYINFCKRDSNEAYEICNSAIRKMQYVKDILEK